MKLFLDVGAHTGQTVEAVLDPKFRFGRIVCFEPSSRSCRALARFRDQRVRIEPFGLWNESCERTIFEPGRKGASIFADKDRLDTSQGEACRLVKASDWFRANVSSNDVAFLKLNCEGAECDIIDDLLDSGEYRKVRAALVFLDVVKISSQAHRAEQTRRRLAASGYSNYAFADEYLATSHRAMLHAWLRSAGAETHSLPVRVAQARYDLVRVAVAGGQALLDGGLLRLLRFVPAGAYRRLQAVWWGIQGQRR